MGSLRIFDILGPVMVGPSSSHTAGAVRIGYITRELLGEEPIKIEMLLHGSFAETGQGHGTDRALVAGLLGMQPDDMRIPNSLRLAKDKGVVVEQGTIQLRDAHPNTVMLRVAGQSGKGLEVIASSLGGGRVQVCQIDGLETHFSGEYPTLVVHNLDQPGHVAQVTGMLAADGVNISSMHLSRDVRVGYAVMVLETDQPISQPLLEAMRKLDGILKVTCINIVTEEAL